MIPYKLWIVFASVIMSDTSDFPRTTDGSGEEQCVEAPYHDSIFSRLEELRFNLEQQMGLEKCIQAYNKIKVGTMRRFLTADTAAVCTEFMRDVSGYTRRRR